MWILIILLSEYFLSAEANVGVLILARGGSKGLRLKNLQKVGGESLLSRAIHTAKSAGLADITVSTDHPLIAFEALTDNVTIFRRSAITAADCAPSIWGASEYLSRRPDVTILVLMQATSPFTKASQLVDALKKINEPVPFDCIFSVTRSFKPRWRNIDGRHYPINFDLKNRNRRQDWNGEILETGAFYISRRSIVEAGYFQNHNCTVQEVNGSGTIEIDTYYDLQVANAVLSAKLV